jgi:membrane glycosyltransferase
MRRLLFAVLVLVLATGLLLLAWHVFAAHGWSGWEVALMACFAAHLPWLALAGATGLVGSVARPVHGTPSDSPALPAAEPPTLPTAEPPTLLAICVRDEAIEPILCELAALLRALGGPHAVALLSDTTDPARGAAEDAAVARLAATLPPGRLLHRRRRDNAGWKAGNVMDFLDHHAKGFELMLLLDADSRMAPGLVRRMIATMAAQPRLALLQATIEGEGATTRFAHWFGVGHAPGGRCWTAGQAWWQEGEGPYWGHNALLRIAPFRAHCRLEPLPDGAHILSHDFVEAARLHAAGWEVRTFAAAPGTSTERHPPDLPTFLARDRRWAAGNLQYRFLLRDRRLSRLGRFQMVQAMAHYLLGPVWFAMLPLAALNAASGGAEGTPRGALLLLLVLSYAALHAPRLIGHLIERTPPWDVLRESAFLLLFESLMAFAKTMTIIAALAGRRSPGWPAQRRDGRRLGWGEAAARLWPHSLAGAVILGLLIASGSGFAVLVGLPAVAGMVLAVPFCVLTARPNLPAAPALGRGQPRGDTA